VETRGITFTLIIQVDWSGTPLDLILNPVDYVVAISRGFVEVVDWKSAKFLQRLRLNGEGRVLCGRAGSIVVCVDGKGKGRGCEIGMLREEGMRSVEVVREDEMLSFSSQN
jgi:hypothetical protein